MKKITTILTAVVMLFATSAFAADGDNVTSTVKKAFKKDFIAASNVIWEKSSDFYFADFLVNGKNASAAYNEDGELVGTSQVITADQLPLTVARAVSQKFGAYQMNSFVTELTYEGKTSYYINVEGEKQTLKLKCDMSGDVSIENRSAK